MQYTDCTKMRQHRNNTKKPSTANIARARFQKNNLEPIHPSGKFQSRRVYFPVGIGLERHSSAKKIGIFRNYALSARRAALKALLPPGLPHLRAASTKYVCAERVALFSL